MSIRPRHMLLHAVAFLAPMYMIYYPPLHEEPRSRTATSLWRSLIAGTCGYVVLAIAGVFSRN